MTDEKLASFKEDFALLIEAGFVAVKQLDELAATRIFQAAQELNKDHAAPKIGMGYIALNKLEIKQATKIFGEVVDKEPENYLAQTFLGICYLLTKPKRKKGEALIKEAMSKTGDETVKNLGSISLEWAEKDLYKAKSPFFAQADTEGEEKGT
ncbi:MAG: tetratricopeptide repeat protein [Parachlamydiaceae bacterium]